MNIAILIDAENVLPSHADLIFAHAQQLGDITHKEIYGAASALTSWVAPVLKYAIHPNLTIKAAKGKNSSDIALVIGAMDLLVAGGVDCVIIASSDSDFSSLSVRLRNAGIEVVGMGTEKANALWRTACSSFVVLQAAKPAQAAKAEPQKQQSNAQAEQPQKQQQNNAQKKDAHATAPTHQERVAVIGQLIQKQLEAHGGRMQTSTLFPSLNRLNDYRVDKQGSGKKPLNYLTSTYAGAFRFEDAPDGINWVSLPGVEAPATAAQEAPAAPAEVEQPEPEPVEAPEPVQEAAAPEEEGYVTPQQVTDKLVDGGFDADVARQITGIFADSASYRAAYNRLRTVFGNDTGRDYYHRAKAILEA